MSMLTTEDFFRGILEAVPELRTTYEEHLADFDELLPHILMADIARFSEERADRIQKNVDHFDITLSKILAYLEKAVGEGDEAVKNIVSVSFIENLDPDAPSYALLRDQLGPNLRRDLEQSERFYSQ